MVRILEAQFLILGYDKGIEEEDHGGVSGRFTNGVLVCVVSLFKNIHICESCWGQFSPTGMVGGTEVSVPN